MAWAMLAGIMARPLRIDTPGLPTMSWPGAIKAVPLFRTTVTGDASLETLGEACEKTGWRVHAYALMGNHYHLLIETPEGNLVAGDAMAAGNLHPALQRATVNGHLFQGRYKAGPVEGRSRLSGGGEHLYSIEPGPVRIDRGRKRTPSYPWSSYPGFDGAGARPGLVGAAARHGGAAPQTGRPPGL